jgi:hypothetical protein
VLVGLVTRIYADPLIGLHGMNQSLPVTVERLRYHEGHRIVCRTVQLLIEETIMLGAVTVTLHLEGRFTGWRVQAARRLINAISGANQGLAVYVDPSDVTLIDQAGRGLLASLRDRGVEFISPDRDSDMANDGFLSDVSKETMCEYPRTSSICGASKMKSTIMTLLLSAWLIRLTAILGFVETFGLLLCYMQCDTVQVESLLLGIMFAALGCLVWKRRLQAAHRFEMAINAYVAMEIAKTMS